MPGPAPIDPLDQPIPFHLTNPRRHKSTGAVLTTWVALYGLAFGVGLAVAAVVEFINHITR